MKPKRNRKAYLEHRRCSGRTAPAVCRTKIAQTLQRAGPLMPGVSDEALARLKESLKKIGRKRPEHDYLAPLVEIDLENMNAGRLDIPLLAGVGGATFRLTENISSEVRRYEVETNAGETLSVVIKKTGQSIRYRSEEMFTALVKKEADLLSKAAEAGLAPKSICYDPRPPSNNGTGMILMEDPGPGWKTAGRAERVCSTPAFWEEFGRKLSQLHGLGIIHNDIDLSNLLISADGSVAFIDFEDSLSGEGSGLVGLFRQLKELQTSVERLHIEEKNALETMTESYLNSGGFERIMAGILQLPSNIHPELIQLNKHRIYYEPLPEKISEEAGEYLRILRMLPSSYVKRLNTALSNIGNNPDALTEYKMEQALADREKFAEYMKALTLAGEIPLLKKAAQKLYENNQSLFESLITRVIELSLDHNKDELIANVGVKQLYGELMPEGAYANPEAGLQESIKLMVTAAAGETLAAAKEGSFADKEKKQIAKWMLKGEIHRVEDSGEHPADGTEKAPYRLAGAIPLMLEGCGIDPLASDLFYELYVAGGPVTKSDLRGRLKKTDIGLLPEKIKELLVIEEEKADENLPEEERIKKHEDATYSLKEEVKTGIERSAGVFLDGRIRVISPMKIQALKDHQERPEEAGMGVEGSKERTRYLTGKDIRTAAGDKVQKTWPLKYSTNLDAFLGDLLHGSKDAVVVDIGIAASAAEREEAGITTRELAQRLMGHAKVVGLDICVDTTRNAFASEISEDIRFTPPFKQDNLDYIECDTLDSIPLKNGTADVVRISRVLDYVDGADEAEKYAKRGSMVREAARTLKEGGTLLVSVAPWPTEAYVKEGKELVWKGTIKDGGNLEYRSRRHPIALRKSLGLTGGAAIVFEGIEAEKRTSAPLDRIVYRSPVDRAKELLERMMPEAALLEIRRPIVAGRRDPQTLRLLAESLLGMVVSDRTNPAANSPVRIAVKDVRKQIFKDAHVHVGHTTDAAIDMKSELLLVALEATELLINMGDPGMDGQSLRTLKKRILALISGTGNSSTEMKKPKQPEDAAGDFGERFSDHPFSDDELEVPGVTEDTAINGKRIELEKEGWLQNILSAETKDGRKAVVRFVEPGDVERADSGRRQIIENLLKNKDNGQTCHPVAIYVDGVFAGFCAADPLFNDAKTLKVNYVQVFKEFPGIGLASIMHKAVIGMAEKLGYDQLVGEVPQVIKVRLTPDGKISEDSSGNWFEEIVNTGDARRLGGIQSYRSLAAAGWIIEGIELKECGEEIYDISLRMAYPLKGEKKAIPFTKEAFEKEISLLKPAGSSERPDPKTPGKRYDLSRDPFPPGYPEDPLHTGWRRTGKGVPGPEDKWLYMGRGGVGGRSIDDSSVGEAILDTIAGAYLIGRHEAVIDFCSNMSVDDPCYWDARLIMGSSYAKLGRNEDALVCFSAVIDSDNVSGDLREAALGAKGDLLNAMKRYDEAIKAYEKIPRKSSVYVLSNYNKGFAYLAEADEYIDYGLTEGAAKRYNLALNAFEVFLSQSKPQPGTDHEKLVRTASLSRAKALHALGRSDDAVACLEEILSKGGEDRYVQQLKNNASLMPKLESAGISRMPLDSPFLTFLAPLSDYFTEDVVTDTELMKQIVFKHLTVLKNLELFRNSGIDFRSSIVRLLKLCVLESTYEIAEKVLDEKQSDDAESILNEIEKEFDITLESRILRLFGKSSYYALEQARKVSFYLTDELVDSSPETAKLLIGNAEHVVKNIFLLKGLGIETGVIHGENIEVLADPELSVLLGTDESLGQVKSLDQIAVRLLDLKLKPATNQENKLSGWSMNLRIYGGMNSFNASAYQTLKALRLSKEVLNRFPRKDKGEYDLRHLKIDMGRREFLEDAMELLMEPLIDPLFAQEPEINIYHTKTIVAGLLRISTRPDVLIEGLIKTLDFIECTFQEKNKRALFIGSVPNAASNAKDLNEFSIRLEVPLLTEKDVSKRLQDGKFAEGILSIIASNDGTDLSGRHAASLISEAVAKGEQEQASVLAGIITNACKGMEKADAARALQRIISASSKPLPEKAALALNSALKENVQMTYEDAVDSIENDALVSMPEKALGLMLYIYSADAEKIAELFNRIREKWAQEGKIETFTALSGAASFMLDSRAYGAGRRIYDLLGELYPKEINEPANLDERLISAWHAVVTSGSTNAFDAVKQAVKVSMELSDAKRDEEAAILLGHANWLASREGIVPFGRYMGIDAFYLDKAVSISEQVLKKKYSWGYKPVIVYVAIHELKKGLANGLSDEQIATAVGKRLKSWAAAASKMKLTPSVGCEIEVVESLGSEYEDSVAKLSQAFDIPRAPDESVFFEWANKPNDDWKAQNIQNEIIRRYFAPPGLHTMHISMGLDKLNDPEDRAAYERVAASGVYLANAIMTLYSCDQRLDMYPVIKQIYRIHHENSCLRVELRINNFLKGMNAPEVYKGAKNADSNALEAIQALGIMLNGLVLEANGDSDERVAGIARIREDFEAGMRRIFTELDIEEFLEIELAQDKTILYTKEHAEAIKNSRMRRSQDGKTLQESVAELVEETMERLRELEDIRCLGLLGSGSMDLIRGAVSSLPEENRSVEYVAENMPALFEDIKSHIAAMAGAEKEVCVRTAARIVLELQRMGFPYLKPGADTTKAGDPMADLEDMLNITESTLDLLGIKASWETLKDGIAQANPFFGSKPNKPTKDITYISDYFKGERTIAEAYADLPDRLGISRKGVCSKSAAELSQKEVFELVLAVGFYMRISWMGAGYFVRLKRALQLLIKENPSVMGVRIQESLIGMINDGYDLDVVGEIGSNIGGIFKEAYESGKRHMKKKRYKRSGGPKLEEIESHYESLRWHSALLRAYSARDNPLLLQRRLNDLHNALMYCGMDHAAGVESPEKAERTAYYRLRLAVLSKDLDPLEDGYLSPAYRLKQAEESLEKSPTKGSEYLAVKALISAYKGETEVARKLREQSGLSLEDLSKSMGDWIKPQELGEPGTIVIKKKPAVPPCSTDENRINLLKEAKEGLLDERIENAGVVERQELNGLLGDVLELKQKIDRAKKEGRHRVITDFRGEYHPLFVLDPKNRHPEYGIPPIDIHPSGMDGTSSGDFDLKRFLEEGKSDKGYEISMNGKKWVLRYSDSSKGAKVKLSDGKDSINRRTITISLHDPEKEGGATSLGSGGLGDAFGELGKALGIEHVEASIYGFGALEKDLGIAYVEAVVYHGRIVPVVEKLYFTENNEKEYSAYIRNKSGSDGGYVGMGSGLVYCLGELLKDIGYRSMGVKNDRTNDFYSALGAVNPRRPALYKDVPATQRNEILKKRYQPFQVLKATVQEQWIDHLSQIAQILGAGSQAYKEYEKENQEWFFSANQRARLIKDVTALTPEEVKELRKLRDYASDTSKHQTDGSGKNIKGLAEKLLQDNWSDIRNFPYDSLQILFVENPVEASEALSEFCGRLEGYARIHALGYGYADVYKAVDSINGFVERLDHPGKEENVKTLAGIRSKVLEGLAVEASRGRIAAIDEGLALALFNRLSSGDWSDQDVRRATWILADAVNIAHAGGRAGDVSASLDALLAALNVLGDGSAGGIAKLLEPFGIGLIDRTFTPMSDVARMLRVYPMEIRELAGRFAEDVLRVEGIDVHACEEELKATLLAKWMVSSDYGADGRERNYESSPIERCLKGMLAKRKGNCFAMAALYDLLAQELGLRSEIMMWPGHPFNGIKIRTPCGEERTIYVDLLVFDRNDRTMTLEDIWNLRGDFYAVPRHLFSLEVLAIHYFQEANIALCAHYMDETIQGHRKLASENLPGHAKHLYYLYRAFRGIYTQFLEIDSGNEADARRYHEKVVEYSDYLIENRGILGLGKEDIHFNYYTKGRALLSLGRFQEAIEAFDDCEASLPQISAEFSEKEDEKIRERIEIKRQKAEKELVREKNKRRAELAALEAGLSGIPGEKIDAGILAEGLLAGSVSLGEGSGLKVGVIEAPKASLDWNIDLGTAGKTVYSDRYAIALIQETDEGPKAFADLSTLGWLVSSLDKLLESSPELSRARILEVLASRAKDLGLFDPALQLYDEAIKTSGESPALLKGKAYCLEASGKIDDALLVYERLAERPVITREDTDAFFRKAAIEIRRGLLDKAEESVDKALRLDSESLPALTRKAEILFERQEYDEAINAAQKIIDNNRDILSIPTDIIEKTKISIASRRTGEEDEALSDRIFDLSESEKEKALKLNIPERRQCVRDALIIKVQGLYRLGKREEAVENFKNLLIADPVMFISMFGMEADIMEDLHNSETWRPDDGKPILAEIFPDVMGGMSVVNVKDMLSAKGFSDEALDLLEERMKSEEISNSLFMPLRHRLVHLKESSGEIESISIAVNEMAVLQEALIRKEVDSSCWYSIGNKLVLQKNAGETIEPGEVDRVLDKIVEDAISGGGKNAKEVYDILCVGEETRIFSGRDLGLLLSVPITMSGITKNLFSREVDPAKVKKNLDVLKRRGFGGEEIPALLKSNNKLLSGDLEAEFGALENMGFEGEALRSWILEHPTHLNYAVKTVRDCKKIGISAKEAGDRTRIYPSFISADKEAKIMELEEVFGFSEKQASALLKDNPDISTGNYKAKAADLLEKLGEYGLDEYDLPDHVLRMPILLKLSVDDFILPRVRFLIEELGVPTDDAFEESANLFFIRVELCQRIKKNADEAEIEIGGAKQITRVYKLLYGQVERETKKTLPNALETEDYREYLDKTIRDILTEVCDPERYKADFKRALPGLTDTDIEEIFKNYPKAKTRFMDIEGIVSEYETAGISRDILTEYLTKKTYAKLILGRPAAKWKKWMRLLREFHVKEDKLFVQCPQIWSSNFHICNLIAEVAKADGRCALIGSGSRFKELYNTLNNRLQEMKGFAIGELFVVFREVEKQAGKTIEEGIEINTAELAEKHPEVFAALDIPELLEGLTFQEYLDKHSKEPEKIKKKIGELKKEKTEELKATISELLYQKEVTLPILEAGRYSRFPSTSRRYISENAGSLAGFLSVSSPLGASEILAELDAVPGAYAWMEEAVYDGEKGILSNPSDKKALARLIEFRLNKGGPEAVECAGRFLTYIGSTPETSLAEDILKEISPLIQSNQKIFVKAYQNISEKEPMTASIAHMLLERSDLPVMPDAISPKSLELAGKIDKINGEGRSITLDEAEEILNEWDDLRGSRLSSGHAGEKIRAFSAENQKTLKAAAYGMLDSARVCDIALFATSTREAEVPGRGAIMHTDLRDLPSTLKTLFFSDVIQNRKVELSLTYGRDKDNTTGLSITIKPVTGSDKEERTIYIRLEEAGGVSVELLHEGNVAQRIGLEKGRERIRLGSSDAAKFMAILGVEAYAVKENDGIMIWKTDMDKIVQGMSMQQRMYHDAAIADEGYSPAKSRAHAVSEIIETIEKGKHPEGKPYIYEYVKTRKTVDGQRIDITSRVHIDQDYNVKTHSASTRNAETDMLEDVNDSPETGYEGNEVDREFAFAKAGGPEAIEHIYNAVRLLSNVSPYETDEEGFRRADRVNDTRTAVKAINSKNEELKALAADENQLAEKALKVLDLLDREDEVNDDEFLNGFGEKVKGDIRTNRIAGSGDGKAAVKSSATEKKVHRLSSGDFRRRTSRAADRRSMEKVASAFSGLKVPKEMEFDLRSKKGRDAAAELAENEFLPGIAGLMGFNLEKLNIRKVIVHSGDGHTLHDSRTGTLEIWVNDLSARRWTDKIVKGFRGKGIYLSREDAKALQNTYTSYILVHELVHGVIRANSNRYSGKGNQVLTGLDGIEAFSDLLPPMILEKVLGGSSWIEAYRTVCENNDVLRPMFSIPRRSPEVLEENRAVSRLLEEFSVEEYVAENLKSREPEETDFSADDLRPVGSVKELKGLVEGIEREAAEGRYPEKAVVRLIASCAYGRSDVKSRAKKAVIGLCIEKDGRSYATEVGETIEKVKGAVPRLSVSDEDPLFCSLSYDRSLALFFLVFLWGIRQTSMSCLSETIIRS
ncbi:MAG: tetratricopeptide repeat protein [Candidatus Altiarchaeota archaeon]|nr:tetratricopeptide repeat protein [Candidatus Altiarchaeota archaeon]